MRGYFISDKTVNKVIFFSQEYFWGQFNIYFSRYILEVHYQPLFHFTLPHINNILIFMILNLKLVLDDKRLGSIPLQ